MENKTQSTEKVNTMVKFCPSFELFNFLQDLRHIILLDIRDKSESNIRSSFKLDGSTTMKQFIEYIEQTTKNAVNFEKKYNSKPIRRAVFITGDTVNPQQPIIGEFTKLLRTQDPTFRVYVLKEGYSYFQKKYPFLCLTPEQLENYQIISQVKEGQTASRENLLTEIQRQVLFASSQFPVEIQENNVYLGNIYHANSDMFLNSLGIKTIIDFTFEHTEEFKKRKDALEKKYKYQHIPLEKHKTVELDFNEINEFIIEQIEEKNSPVLLFCKDGNSLSPIFAISWLMYQKNLQFQIASIKIFQYRAGVMDVCKNAYQQLMVYTPKKEDNEVF